MDKILGSTSIVGFQDKDDFVQFSVKKVEELARYNGELMPKEIHIVLMDSGNYKFNVTF